MLLLRTTLDWRRNTKVQHERGPHRTLMIRSTTQEGIRNAEISCKQFTGTLNNKLTNSTEVRIILLARHKSWINFVKPSCNVFTIRMASKWIGLQCFSRYPYWSWNLNKLLTFLQPARLYVDNQSSLPVHARARGEWWPLGNYSGKYTPVPAHAFDRRMTAF